MFTYSTFYLTGFCFFSCSAWLCGLLSNGFQEVRKCFFVRIHRCFFMKEALMQTVPNCIQTIPDRLGIRFPGIGNRGTNRREFPTHADDVFGKQPERISRTPFFAPSVLSAALVFIVVQYYRLPVSCLIR